MADVGRVQGGERKVNVARKLISKIEEDLSELKRWVEMHELAFDHSKIKKEVHDIWMEYHDSIMEGKEPPVGQVYKEDYYAMGGKDEE